MNHLKGKTKAFLRNKKTIWVMRFLFYFIVLMAVYIVYGFGNDTTFIYNEF